MSRLTFAGLLACMVVASWLDDPRDTLAMSEPSTEQRPRDVACATDDAQPEACAP